MNKTLTYLFVAVLVGAGALVYNNTNAADATTAEPAKEMSGATDSKCAKTCEEACKDKSAEACKDGSCSKK